MQRSHDNQRGIDDILRMEKEEATLYGLHNMESFNKIKNKFKFFLVKPIGETTIQVKKYTNDEEVILDWARRNSDFVLIKEGEFII